MDNIPMIGAALSAGASSIDCEHGPNNLMQSERLATLPFDWQSIITQKDGLSKREIVADVCNELASYTKKCSRPFAVIGGDHSCAIGTWSGLSHSLRDTGPMGLIWVDAHMDSHTPETTESGNIHGMPLATLLGYGDTLLTSIGDSKPKILPEHVCLIGIRSFEEDEAKLLASLNVSVMTMNEVNDIGMDAAIKEALRIVKNGTCGFGISIDVDGFDPVDAPGTGIHEANGLHADDFLRAISQCREDLLGVEIAEYDPNRDIDDKTQTLIIDILETFFIKT